MKGVPRPWSGSTVRGRPDSAYSGGVRGPCLPASSDRLHRIQVAQPQGDPSGIISLRVPWCCLSGAQGDVTAGPGLGGHSGPSDPARGPRGLGWPYQFSEPRQFRVPLQRQWPAHSWRSRAVSLRCLSKPNDAEVGDHQPMPTLGHLMVGRWTSQDALGRWSLRHSTVRCGLVTDRRLHLALDMLLAPKHG